MRARRRLATTTALVLTSLLGGALVAQPATAQTTGSGPAAPRSVVAKVADGALALTWSMPKGTPAAAITAYAVHYRAAGATAWSAAQSTASRSLRVAPLANGTRYELQVRARTATASGPWSAAVAATPGRTPGVVTGVRVLRFGAGGTAVSWSRPVDAGGRALSGYDVRFRTGVSGAWHRVRRTTTASTTLRALGAGAQVEVRAVSSRGTGPWSAAASPVAVTPDAAPSGLRATAARGSVTLTWTAAAGVTDYTVRWRRAGSTQWSTRVVATAGTTLVGLPVAPVRFSVAKDTPAGIGRFSASVTSVPGRVPAAAPRSPKAAAGDGAVTVSWTRPAAGAAKAYEVRFRRTGTSTWHRVRTTHRSVVVRRLTDGHAYRFAVRALRPASGPWSMTVDATPTVRAKAPTALALHLDPTTTALAATWTAPTSGPTAQAYDVRYRAASATSWTTVATTGSAAATTLTGLPTGSAYTVQVRARTAGGGGAWSAAAGAYVPRLTLPVMDVETTGGAAIVDKETYLPTSVSVADPTTPANAYSGTAQIKGHGNSTWPLPKKPYHLKLDTKASLLGMPANKHWILLANYKDRTLLRNDVALYLGKQTGLAWTPDSRFVELVVNGRYEGLYQLAEQVRIDPARVNIDALSSKDTSASKITGGYLLERDGNRDAATEAGFGTPAGEPITIDDPEVPTAAQQAYISGYVDDFEAALYSDHRGDPETGYAKYIDVDSFVDWYIVEELVENSDAWFSSAYLVKPRGGRLQMGPLWDFDLSTMNAGVTKGKATSWYVRNLGWWAQLTKDPAFEQRVAERWQLLKPRFDTVWARIAAQRTAMATAAAQDEQVWGYTTHDANVDAMSAFLRTREAWLDTQWRVR